MYRMAPLTNRRAFLSALCMFATAGGAYVIYGIVWIALALCISGLALVPIQFAVRSWAVKKMIEQCEDL